MKILFDLFPVVLFFATYKFASHGHLTTSCLAANESPLPLIQEPILLATGVAIAATIAQVAWLIAHRKKVDSMLWLSLAVITVFGGATLYFRNPVFIQWKPTILYWLFATALLFSNVALRKNLIRQMLENQLSLPAPIWSRLNIAWALFFFALGTANLAAVRILSCDSWVSFKLYGLTGLMFAFIIGQSLVLTKYMEEGNT